MLVGSRFIVENPLDRCHTCNMESAYSCGMLDVIEPSEKAQL